MSKETNRIVWIDNAKAMGMFLIVLGHMFPPHLSAFIYSFHVPLFFFISGYLAKNATSQKKFWNNVLNNLVFPYLLFSLIVDIPFIYHNISCPNNIGKMFTQILLGFHSFDGIVGCQQMWFVYSLIFAKIIYQYANTRLNSIIIIICLIGLVCYNFQGLKLKWGLTNLLYAYPYFCLGSFCKRNGFLNRIFDTLGSKQLAILSLLPLCVCLSLSAFNGIAYMYEGGVGNNLTINLLCSISGILWMVFIANLLDSKCTNVCSIISRGSIVILGLHLYFVMYALRILHRLIILDGVIADLAYIILAIAICVIFIPIIRFIQKHVPVLIGKR